MSTSSRLRARYNMDEVHERLLRAAETSERLPEIDLQGVSRIASDAYQAAMRKGESLAQAESRALSALEQSAPDTARMHDQALQELARSENRGRLLDGSKREFAYDFLFAWPVPAVGALIVWQLAVSQSDWLAKGVFGLFCVAFAAAAYVAFSRIGKLVRGSNPRGWNSILVHSGGSLAAGLCVLVCFVTFAQREGTRTREQDLTARLEKVNQAAAVTLAAMQAGATVKETQDAVSRSTAVDWITVESAPRTDGVVLARAALARTQTAELRLASLSGGSPRLASFLRTKSGESVPYADYVSGNVVKAELDKVTLAVGPDNAVQIFNLPAGTLPPPVGSEVVAAVTRSDKMAVFLQPIDSVVLGLKR